MLIDMQIFMFHFLLDRNEQSQIIDFIEVSCSKIDCQWEKIERSLERLHEYRAALIIDAVTGQLSELR